MQKASTKHAPESRCAQRCTHSSPLGWCTAEWPDHPAWALSLNPGLPASAVSGALLFSWGGTGSPTAREGVPAQLDGAPARSRHNLSPSPQPPELAPCAAYCVHGWAFYASINLFFNSTITPGHCRRTWPDISFSQGLGPGTSGIRRWHSQALFLSLPRGVTLGKAGGRRGDTVL